jgi:DNA-binding NarL/FixJ family response regulator
MSTTLVLIDDHPLILDGLEQLLSSTSEFQIVARCGTAAEGLKAISSLDPDVVLLDLSLPDEHGLHVLQKLNFSSRPPVVVLTASDDVEDLLTAVSCGARGVVLKAMAPRVLEDCIRKVQAGGLWLRVEDVDLVERLANRKRIEAELASQLTRREIDILRLAAARLDNDEIASRLAISVGTTKIHLHHIYDKLQLSGRRDLNEFLQSQNY